MPKNPLRYKQTNPQLSRPQSAAAILQRLKPLVSEKTLPKQGLEAGSSLRLQITELLGPELASHLIDVRPKPGEAVLLVDSAVWAQRIRLKCVELTVQPKVKLSVRLANARGVKPKPI